ncbi:MULTISPECIES: methylamine utilization protein [Giesbergeria]|uniref:Methylamine utilization protein n=1 Tax=Giesbergeria sinuosa TaxID=80883 RepID=A0ABV9QCK8_9BURK
MKKAWPQTARYGTALLWATTLGIGYAQAGSVHIEVQSPTGLPLAQAVVYLESAQARRQVKPLPRLEMAQEKKRFVPQVLVVPVGSEVSFPNQDTVRHHVYSFSAAKKFELKLYSGTPADPVRFEQPGVVVLGCNIHDQMVGWIVVVETPYYGQTAAHTGRVQIDHVPAGNYRLRVWHPRLPIDAPATDQALTVGATDTVSATVQLQELTP